MKHFWAWKITHAGKGWGLKEDSGGCDASSLCASALTSAGEKTGTLDLTQYGCPKIFNLQAVALH